MVLETFDRIFDALLDRANNSIFVTEQQILDATPAGLDAVSRQTLDELTDGVQGCVDFGQSRIPQFLDAIPYAGLLVSVQFQVQVRLDDFGRQGDVDRSLADGGSSVESGDRLVDRLGRWKAETGLGMQFSIIIIG